ncbi:hypothetical protein [Salinilacihabitans rarus]|uniref:hypothetical protein n=1 Tax=Salinilacihabitans rarus TaxID=2961596 RepID=UPI0020C895F3|nr:hypothetical protein [Salinilacihabitans rarus]
MGLSTNRPSIVVPVSRSSVGRRVRRLDSSGTDRAGLPVERAIRPPVSTAGRRVEDGERPTIEYVHRGATPADRPTVDDLLDRIDELASGHVRR